MATLRAEAEFARPLWVGVVAVALTAEVGVAAGLYSAVKASRPVQVAALASG